MSTAPGGGSPAPKVPTVDQAVAMLRRTQDVKALVEQKQTHLRNATETRCPQPRCRKGTAERHQASPFWGAPEASTIALTRSRRRRAAAACRRSRSHGCRAPDHTISEQVGCEQAAKAPG